MLCLLAVTPMALAHDGGEFGVTIPVERIAPGADLPIEGADWAPGATLEVRLQSAGLDAVTIARIRTNDDGHFATAVRLPDPLPPGTATIQVVSDYGVLDTAVVTIDPSAPPPPPLPSGDGGVIDAAAAGSTDLVPLLALGLAGLAISILVLKPRRPARPV